MGLTQRKGEATVEKRFRRIVTGHSEKGIAIIASDCLPERIAPMGPHGPFFHEVWNTDGAPASIDRFAVEPPVRGLVLTPPSRGTRIRVNDFPPESTQSASVDANAALKQFENIGGGKAFTGGHGSDRHPLMHRTETIDYGIVLEGEITLILDESETVVRAGDIVVQRGTNHAWANRSKANCRVAFILVDGQFGDGL
jgi:mannose-6-phosphate isomerase-like protein (cupin superfamily)